MAWMDHVSAASAASDSAASMTPWSDVVGGVLDCLDMKVDWNACDEDAARARLVTARQLDIDTLIVTILLCFGLFNVVQPTMVCRHFLGINGGSCVLLE